MDKMNYLTYVLLFQVEHVSPHVNNNVLLSANSNRIFSSCLAIDSALQVLFRE